MWVTGDETGLIKLIENDTAILAFGEQDRARGIISLAAQSLAGPDPSFLSLRKDGTVERWGVVRGHDGVSNLLLQRSVPQAVAAPLSIHCLAGSASGESSGSFLVASSQGELHVHRQEGDVVRIAGQGPLSACLVSESAGRCIVGGKENDVQVYDVAIQQSVWKAKNVPNDKLNLRVPVWVTCLALAHSNNDNDLPSDSHREGAGSHCSMFAAGTAHRHVRLYDTSASQRPQLSLTLPSDFAVRSLRMASSEQVFVGDAAGNLSLYDLRSPKNTPLQVLKGCRGSVRSMVFGGEGAQRGGGKLLGCVGLDRYLRVYNMDTCKTHSAVYLKNRLNALLCLPRQGAGNGGREGTEEGDEEGYGGEAKSGSEDDSEMSEDFLSAELF